jgi:hypothetical protein
VPYSKKESENLPIEIKITLISEKGVISGSFWVLGIKGESIKWKRTLKELESLIMFLEIFHDYFMQDSRYPSLLKP